MKNVNIAADLAPRARSQADAFSGESGARPTPADFFKDAGTVIAVCLGLGLLMQILLG